MVAISIVTATWVSPVQAVGPNQSKYAWLLGSQKYEAGDQRYPVGAYVKALRLSRIDHYFKVCEPWESPGSGCTKEKTLSGIEVQVDFSVHENNFLTDQISGRLLFNPSGVFDRAEGDVKLAENGGLTLFIFWPQRFGDRPNVRFARQLAQFSHSNEQLLASETFYAPYDSKVIHRFEEQYFKAQ